VRTGVIGQLHQLLLLLLLVVLAELVTQSCRLVRDEWQVSLVVVLGLRVWVEARLRAQTSNWFGSWRRAEYIAKFVVDVVVVACDCICWPMLLLLLEVEVMLVVKVVVVVIGWSVILASLDVSSVSLAVVPVAGLLVLIWLRLHEPSASARRLIDALVAGRRWRPSGHLREDWRAALHGQPLRLLLLLKLALGDQLLLVSGMVIVATLLMVLVVVVVGAQLVRLELVLELGLWLTLMVDRVGQQHYWLALHLHLGRDSARLERCKLNATAFAAITTTGLDRQSRASVPLAPSISLSSCSLVGD